MRVVRNLCLYQRRSKPLCFVPDKTQFPISHQTIQPHIFTEAEIGRLLKAVKKLQPSLTSPIRQENFRLALILLYTTGLRSGELSQLRIGDYDPMERTLLIRESKFHKSRLLPLSHDGWKELENYLKIRRKRRLPISKDSALIWNCSINRKTTETGFYTKVGLGRNFEILFCEANIYTAKSRHPRLHDFRHTFAVHALLRWYHEGVDVQAKLPFLSIYMGHVSIISTQYYLQFIEDIVSSASKRFEEHYGNLINKFNQGEQL